MLPIQTKTPETAIGITICVCTMDRIESLRACLESIRNGSVLPSEVLVSDDGIRVAETAQLCSQFSFVRYLAGPRNGLCANRNSLVAQAGTSHVSLIDDDGVVATDFIERALQQAHTQPPNVIITGSVLEFGKQLFLPGSPDVWGNFTQNLRHGRYETIQLNCNLFPKSAFQEAVFDELIQYGFEDMDLCSHLLSLGYAIEWDPLLVNSHFPPLQTTDISTGRFRRWEQARYYTSLKRYFIWERRRFAGFLYLIAAPLYTIAFSAKWRKWSRIPCVPVDFFLAVSLFVTGISRITRVDRFTQIRRR